MAIAMKDMYTKNHPLLNPGHWIAPPRPWYSYISHSIRLLETLVDTASSPFKISIFGISRCVRNDRQLTPVICFKHLHHHVLMDLRLPWYQLSFLISDLCLFICSCGTVDSSWTQILPSWHLKKLARCTFYEASCRTLVYLYITISAGPQVRIGIYIPQALFEWLFELVTCYLPELRITWSSFCSNLWVISPSHNLVEIFLTRKQTCTTSPFLMIAGSWNVWSMEYTSSNSHNPFSSSTLGSRDSLLVLEMSNSLAE